jgi:hypothetical protein
MPVPVFDSRALRTLEQFAEENPAFPIGTLRWFIDRRAEYGFDKVVVQIGRRYYIDTRRFNDWLAQSVLA